jgi:hypothetical protein
MKSKQMELKAGDVFTWLTLTGRTFKKKSSEGWNITMYEAVCKCGIVKGYQKKYLLNGNTKSCGCYKRVAQSKAITIHNLSRHPLFTTYKDMLRRCYISKCKAYRDYGARGITVCEEWRNDIKVFYDWAVSNGWSKGLQIDRENNEGNYCPENCRFVTKEVNNKNTRRNVFLTAFGETKCMSDWLADKRCKVKGNGLKERLKTGKWSNEEAITTPPNLRKKEFSRKIKTVKLVTAFGETKTIIEWSEDKRCKVGYSGLKIRLGKGYSAEDAISLEFRK